MGKLLTLMIIAAALYTAAPAALAASPVGTTVSALDEYCARHRVQPLPLDSSISRVAQDWADHLQATGEFRHRPFTAAVWKSANRVGVGISQCRNGVYAVMNFAPQGNVFGQFRANVLLCGDSWRALFDLPTTPTCAVCTAATAHSAMSSNLRPDMAKCSTASGQPTSLQYASTRPTTVAAVIDRDGAEGRRGVGRGPPSPRH